MSTIAINDLQPAFTTLSASEASAVVGGFFNTYSYEKTVTIIDVAQANLGFVIKGSQKNVAIISVG